MLRKVEVRSYQREDWRAQAATVVAGEWQFPCDRREELGVVQVSERMRRLIDQFNHSILWSRWDIFTVMANVKRSMTKSTQRTGKPEDWWKISPDPAVVSVTCSASPVEALRVG